MITRNKSLKENFYWCQSYEQVKLTKLLNVAKRRLLFYFSHSLLESPTSHWNSLSPCQANGQQVQQLNHVHIMEGIFSRFFKTDGTLTNKRWAMLDKKRCRFVNTTNWLFELFSVDLVEQYLSRSSVSSWRQQKSSAKILPTHVEERDVSLFWLPLCDIPSTSRRVLCMWHIQKAHVKYRVHRISCFTGISVSYDADIKLVCYYILGYLFLKHNPSWLSTQYKDFAEIFSISLDLSTIYFAHSSGCWASFVYSCHSILECYNLFSGVNLSIRSFCFILSSLE